MNRPLAHLLGWASLAIGAALIAAIVLTPPWLDLQYTHWERGFIEACAKSQSEQVEAYEQFASALSSNDPVLLQRLAYHHLRLKPSYTEFVSIPQGTGEPDLTAIFEDAGEARSLHAPPARTTLIEEWLHRAHPVVGIDYPPYEPPDSMFIRLATGPRRLLLLGLGGVFLLCGLILPGPVRAVEVDAEEEIAPEPREVEPVLETPKPAMEPEATVVEAPAVKVNAIPVETVTPVPVKPATPPTEATTTPTTADIEPIAAAAEADDEFVPAMIDEDDAEDDRVEAIREDQARLNDEDEEHPATA